MDIMESIWQRAKADPKKVAFPEATEEKILLAARECADKGICKPVLVGAVKDIEKAAAQYGISLEGIELAEAFDEEKTLALAEEYSADTGSNTNGGLYENVFEGQMVEEFNDFCFDPAREPGDTGIVFNEGTYCGYHIIYFVSWGEPYRDVLADDSLRSADFSAWDAEISEGYEATIGFGMRYAM